MTAFDHSTINVHGGTIHGTVNAYGTINLYGGNKAGGASLSALADIQLHDALRDDAPGLLGVAPLSGLPDLFALDDGLLQLFGTGLEETLEDPEFFYEGEDFTGYFHKYALSGFLLDGTGIDGVSLLVQNGSGASFALINQVPEPGSIFLFGLGSALLAARPRSPTRSPAASADSFVSRGGRGNRRNERASGV